MDLETRVRTAGDAVTRRESIAAEAAPTTTRQRVVTHVWGRLQSRCRGGESRCERSVNGHSLVRPDVRDTSRRRFHLELTDPHGFAAIAQAQDDRLLLLVAAAEAGEEREAQ